MLATQNQTLTGNKVANMGYNVKLEKEKTQISQAMTFECREIGKIMQKDAIDEPELDYEGMYSRLFHVFDSMVAELERRNRTWPELLEEYDDLKQKNAILIREKDYFFHTMQDWRSQFLNIEKWRNFAFEAMLELPKQYQSLLIQKIHELEDKDRNILDQRMKELFASEKQA